MLEVHLACPYDQENPTRVFAVIGRKMQRYRHQELMRFLNLIDARVPASKAMHVILGN